MSARNVTDAFAELLSASRGKKLNLSPVVSDQFATGLPLRLTTFAQTLLNRLLYVCVGVAWAAASLASGLAIWDGNKAASTAVFVAVGAVMVATFATAVGWFAWKQRN